MLRIMAYRFLKEFVSTLNVRQTHGITSRIKRLTVGGILVVMGLWLSHKKAQFVIGITWRIKINKASLHPSIFHGLIKINTIRWQV